MKRLGYALGLAGVLATSVALLASTAGRFDQKLAVDKQIVHVLNRLTFGPRPGDIEQVRRIGVDKWIDLQLHPDRIAENPVLEAKLKPLGTLQLAAWQILDKYPQTPAALTMRTPAQLALQTLPQKQLAALNNCSVADRQTLLASFEPDTRRLVLTAASPQVLEGLPDDIQKESAALKKAEQDERQKMTKRFMPPLNEILDAIRCASSTAEPMMKRWR